MCPSTPSTPASVHGPRLFTSDRSVQDLLLELRAHIDLLESKAGSISEGSASFGANCLLPLSPSQSHLLADLVTIFVPRSTWWSTLERQDSWVLCGKVGEDFGPQVTVFITATSDRDVMA